MVRMSPGTGVRSHILRANDEVASALGELAELMAIAGGDSFRAGTALEINAFPDRLDLNDELARAAQDLGMVFSIATDAHSVRHLDNIRYGVATDLGRRRRAIRHVSRSESAARPHRGRLGRGAARDGGGGRRPPAAGSRGVTAEVAANEQADNIN
jgi:hypothetical protein